MKWKKIIKIISVISGVGVCGCGIYKLANIIVVNSVGVGFGYFMGITEMGLANALADQSVIAKMEGVIEKLKDDESFMNSVLVEGIKRGVQRGKADSISYELKNEFLYK